MKKKNLSRKTESAYVKICPNCKSEDIFQEKSTMQALGYLHTRYVCENCGYGGFQTIEVKQSELKNLKKNDENKNAKSELIDMSYGKFAVRLLWKILGPISIVIGIFLIFDEEKFLEISGIYYILTGIFMLYITYFKKRKLSEN